MNDILESTDAIVRGRIGQPSSYLSLDGRTIYTEYEVVNLSVLYQTARVAKKTLKQDVTRVGVTLQGGSVAMRGLKYTLTFDALPALQPGMECLFLLDETDDRYYLSGRYHGAFAVETDHLRPLAIGPEFVFDLQEESVSEAISAIVARRREYPG